MSKTISYLLRHGAEKEGIAIDEEGYVLVSEVLRWLHTKGLDTNIDDLRDIVTQDKKGRYSMSTDDTRIRANQGHSIVGVDRGLLTPFVGTGQLLHGTYQRHRESILQTGLSCMTRTHVHMIRLPAPGETGWWHMIRKDIDMYVLVDLDRAQADGMEFSLSANGVVLSSGFDGVIPAKYLTLLSPMEPARGAPCYGVIVVDREAQQTVIVETPAGHQGFPKGKREKGECALACALRELYEETGLTPADIVIGEQVYVEQPTRSTCYFQASLRAADLKDLQCKDPTELAHVGWLGLSVVLDSPKLHSRRKSILHQLLRMTPI